jgi:hypothetical protein
LQTRLFKEFDACQEEKVARFNIACNQKESNCSAKFANHIDLSTVSCISITLFYASSHANTNTQSISWLLVLLVLLLLLLLVGQAEQQVVERKLLVQMGTKDMISILQNNQVDAMLYAFAVELFWSRVRLVEELTGRSLASSPLQQQQRMRR